MGKSFESWVKKEIPGALMLLDELQNKYKLACLTNASPMQWPIVQETIRADDYFEYQFVSHLMGKVKPDAETYEHVSDALNASSKNIMFFDDSAQNVVAAKEVAIKAYLVKGISEIRSVLTENGNL